MTMEASITSRTEDQERQLRRFTEDAVKHGVDLALIRIDPDRDGLQHMLEQGDEFKSDMADFLIAQMKNRTVTNRYADEEAESSYGYLSGYTQPIGITEQVARLRELFPGLGTANIDFVGQNLPDGAEGLLAFPRWEKVAPTYGEAVQKVLDLIKQARNGQFYNYCGRLWSQHLRQSAKSVAAMTRLSELEGNTDIVAVPVQLGLLYRGNSVRRALERMSSREFGLGAFAVGIALLTHPNRLRHYDDLWIDCAGDEFSSEGDGGFGKAPCFGFGDGGVEFVTGWVDVTHGSCGSASAFIPQ